jgi:methyl-accepting chemotaxis protein
MKQVGLKTWLLLAIAFLAVLMLGIATVGHRGMVDAEKLLAETYDDEIVPLLQLKSAHDAYAVDIASLSERIAADRLSWNEATQAVVAARNRADAAWKAYVATDATPPEKVVAAELMALQPSVDAAMLRLRDILQRQDREQLRAFSANELQAALGPYSAKLNQLTELQRANVAAKIARVQSDDDSLKTELIAGTAIALGLTLLLGFLLMRLVSDLRVLVQQVQKAGLHIGTSVTEVAATAREQQATANEIAATTSEIGATSKEISATSKELVKTMTDVSHGAEQTASLAGSGHAGLARMEEMMRQVMEAAGAINAKLAVLSEKAGNINQVVTTITKVADQTNLLSLNAAIEAEKAGEYGRGFSVVATEIRRLADQTAVATFDIEQIVKEMLSAVSASVMGMDKFSEEVRRGVDEVRKVGAQLAQIIEQVQVLTPRFESVNEGMQAQASGAQQISEALSQLSEAAQQTVETLRQSNLAIEQLNETAGGLRTSIERIRT